MNEPGKYEKPMKGNNLVKVSSLSKVLKLIQNFGLMNIWDLRILKTFFACLVFLTFTIKFCLENYIGKKIK